MRNSQRLGIAGAATALGLLGFAGAAAAADIAPGEGYYQPAPRYAYPVEPAPVYAQRRHVEIQDDGECRYIVRRSVDPYGNEHERRVEDCNEGRGPGAYDEDMDPDYAARPRPPAVIDPDDDRY
jgi:hypothetical protein